MDGISYPVVYQKVKQIEKKNDFRINACRYESGEIFILHVSEKSHRDVIKLLLICNAEHSHYNIHDFSIFMSRRTHHNGVQHYCFRRLHGLSRKSLLDEHTRNKPPKSSPYP